VTEAVSPVNGLGLAEEQQYALAEAHLRHPHARHLEVIKFDPENWVEIYRQLGFNWPAYEDYANSCPHTISGRGDTHVAQGDWIILNDAPRRSEVLGGVRAADLV
jgi:hypothetical protein